MASIGRTLGAYLADGLQVWLFPVSTFRRAADRDLSVRTFVAVLVSLGLISGITAFLSSVALLEGPVTQILPLALFSEMLWVFVQVLMGGGLLYGAVRLFGSIAAPRRMLSAMLVFPALQLVVSLVVLVLLAFVLPMASDRMTTIQSVGTLGSIASMALAFIMISYTVLAARFGGAVGYPAATGATLLVFGVLALIYAAIAWNVTVIPSVGLMP